MGKRKSEGQLAHFAALAAKGAAKRRQGEPVSTPQPETASPALLDTHNRSATSAAGAEQEPLSGCCCNSIEFCLAWLLPLCLFVTLPLCPRESGTTPITEPLDPTAGRTRMKARTPRMPVVVKAVARPPPVTAAHRQPLAETAVLQAQAQAERGEQVARVAMTALNDESLARQHFERNAHLAGRRIEELKAKKESTAVASLRAKLNTAEGLLNKVRAEKKVFAEQLRRLRKSAGKDKRKLIELDKDSTKQLKKLLLDKSELHPDQKYLRELIENQLSVLSNKRRRCMWHPKVLEFASAIYLGHPHAQQRDRRCPAAPTPRGLGVACALWGRTWDCT
eukprot:CAMPEP_0181218644 /NCGR_PEP_ID=MMETSP1096-20121128/27807_1 /TAXON_ID=156174 ORGANISM="Chrysochromulina ericina, Strain CCMP281" /NCGR_SAMPLE_ID=MMETSP1096 /ASSEMBLY_ACC=CAM_ASM_000453 /LENGTH=335 /DNA_ID=CAMNT_0023310881 /DNA_START=48 /DNA_END=1057 /DNA_ORIENTATION=+